MRREDDRHVAGVGTERIVVGLTSEWINQGFICDD
jgi:hypothetical protein